MKSYPAHRRLPSNWREPCLFTADERSQRTVERKAREIVLAAEITRRYTKDQILELYLNEIYYGNLSYGIEAAAETYFQTSADKLTLSQAAFLAGLPQAPSVYDVYNNRDETLQRFHAVLLLMLARQQREELHRGQQQPPTGMRYRDGCSQRGR